MQSEPETFYERGAKTTTVNEATPPRWISAVSLAFLRRPSRKLRWRRGAFGLSCLVLLARSLARSPVRSRRRNRVYGKMTRLLPSDLERGRACLRAACEGAGEKSTRHARISSSSDGRTDGRTDGRPRGREREKATSLSECRTRKPKSKRAGGRGKQGGGKPDKNVRVAQPN